MAFSSEQLNQIYNRTSGYCHICHKKLAFKNYGVFGARGAWEVEHSNPQAKGGTNRLNNLYPACITCNRSKGASRTENLAHLFPPKSERAPKSKMQSLVAQPVLLPVQFSDLPVRLWAP